MLHLHNVHTVLYSCDGRRLFLYNSMGGQLSVSAVDGMFGVCSCSPENTGMLTTTSALETGMNFILLFCLF